MKWQIQDMLPHIAQSIFNGDKTLWIDHVCIDSKKVKKNSAFIALKGQNHDGHDFVESAFQSGASIAVVEKKLNLPNTLMCHNTQTALTEMGKWARKQIKHPVIGITGSSGKTTTKEILQHILSAVGQTQSTQGNLNNHLGVPLTLLNFQKEMNFSIVEMGMSAKGEIDFLCQMSKPEVGLITSIGPAHIENFDGSLEKVAQAKGELFLSLNSNNIAIVNADEPLIQALPTKAKKITYGFNVHSDVCITKMDIQNGGTDFTLTHKGTSYSGRIALVGRYHIQNVAGAFATAVALQVDLEKIISKFESFQVYQGRGQVISFKHGFIIDDTYNANPASMEGALETLSWQFKNFKKIVVLGDMLELGSNTSDWHFKVGQKAHDYKVDDMFVYGNEAKNYLKGFGIEEYQYTGHHFLSHTELAQKLFQTLNSNEKVAILFKGSRGMKMELALKELLNCVNQN